MTVVERRERNGSRDQFPIGMRVLAVDDDPTCLKVLELLLLRCQYHVTTTNQAIKALGMLRENKDQFDLVISDVHMPDMDGFKLLELVGLEMDLPVIMLSANGETDAVMKGITHGACDYLLKPVRLEELKNIWQHVIRRKKFDTRDQNNLDCDKIHHTNSGAARGSWANGSSDQNVKPNKKRKDQNEEDGDDGDGNSNENEDPAAQKKPRVVWSVELHRKFVAAVNQLGIDKAVPKRILELMNVEGITRENVASHLQKYRLYLKRLTTVANHQANMVAALRGRDTSYLAMGSLDGYANFNPLVGSRTLLNRTAFQSNGSIPRLNNFTGFGLHGYVPSGTSKTGLQTTQATQQGTLIPRFPTPLEVNRFQQPKAILEPSNCLLGGFSTNSLTNVTKSPQILTRNQQQTESFEIGITGSSLSSDLGRCDETWQGAFQSTIYPTSLPFSHGDMSSVNIKDQVSQLGSSSCDVSSSSVVMTRNDALANAQNQASTILTTRNYNGDANLLDFRSPGNSNLSWEEPNSLMSNFHINDQNVGNQQLGNGFSNKTMDLSITSQTNFGAPFPMQCSKSDKAIGAIQAHIKDRPLFDDVKLQGEFSSGGSELDDVVANATIKPEEGEDFTFIEGDCSDFYPFGACM